MLSFSKTRRVESRPWESMKNGPNVNKILGFFCFPRKLEETFIIFVLFTCLGGTEEGPIQK